MLRSWKTKLLFLAGLALPVVAFANTVHASCCPCPLCPHCPLCP
jgi:hypothetical protein